MKLKNIMNDVRQFTANGQIIYVQPKETIEVENAIYDDRVFKLIDIKKSTEKEEKINNDKEVKTNDSSK